jgi:hypothetical protein
VGVRGAQYAQGTGQPGTRARRGLLWGGFRHLS